VTLEQPAKLAQLARQDPLALRVPDSRLTEP